MSRPSNLSPDNILRFLQVKRSPVSADEVISGLDLKKSDRRPLYKMLSKLKKRGAITEIPGGRYRLGGRKVQAGDRPAKDVSGREFQEHATTKAWQTSTNQPRPPAGAIPADQATGRLVLHHDGYGFVVLGTPAPPICRGLFTSRGALS